MRFGINGRDGMRPRSKGSIMLLELILCMLIFSLCAAASVSIFAKARVESNEARALSVASLKAQSAAEAFKAAKGSVSEAAELVGGYCPGNFHFVQHFDDEWNEVSSNTDNVLTLCVVGTDEETGLVSADISVCDGERVIFQMETAYLSLVFEAGGAAQ